ncbi:dipeptide ABC transporter ATP-binding protein [Streptomyces silvisoli]|uniref:ABC transporter ATP-binding protein n=1 Tax=Streptomyces silvisoli TaxID=3034235 RepID=A0ABT5ZI37_9ACTN|nr:ABC transporter ATP-binding protein [Streptomyces silvisoli]MDF3289485.1 ABC transporter ATP-binding protein [Streptomyces silvisoli]
MGGEDPVLRVRDLRVAFGGVDAVRGVHLELRRGEVLGLVGESGSGKSTVALAVLGLLPDSATVSGSVRLDGVELCGAGDAALSRLRGNRIAMVFQDPLSAFTPVHRIGDQIAETIRAHRDISRRAARERAVELLDLVGIPEPRARAAAFPHEFSGGMRQRAMIAMAVANEPDVLLADEPTTALDVTIQAQVLDVLRTAQRATGAAMLLVSHDLGVIAGTADRVAVMYAGRIVETAPVHELFAAPRMPYTLGLIGAVPRLDGGTGTGMLVPVPGAPPAPGALPSGCSFAPRCPLADDVCRAAEPPLRQLADDHLVACRKAEELQGAAPADVFPVPEVPRTPAGPEDRPEVLRVTGLVKTFPLLKGVAFKRRVGSVYAVDGIDLRVRCGETLALVGESGSGKSTALFEVLGLSAPEGGSIEVLGQDVAGLTRQQAAALRGRTQIVFQDPMASLDPRMTVAGIIVEPLLARGVARAEAARRVPELLRQVGLEPGHADRFPHEFSGGQRQRIGIARALSVRPDLVVLDEPVSALDVSVQAGVLNLLRRLKAELGLAYLFVSHDLSVVRNIADRVSVVYLGRTVEAGAVREVFERPLHPYTQALLSAVPLPDPGVERRRARVLLAGDPPSPTQRHTGCRFRARCPLHAELAEADRERCVREVPQPVQHADDHVAACHFARPRAVLTAEA